MPFRIQKKSKFRLVAVGFSLALLFACLSILLAASPASAAATQTAVVIHDDTPRYTDSSAASVMDTVDAGKVITVTAQEGTWYRGDTGSQVYYIAASHIKILTGIQNPDGSRDLYKAVVISQTAPIYRAPDTGAAILKTHVQGAILQFNVFCDGWYMAQVLIDDTYQLGFISADDMELFDMTQDTADRAVYQGVILASGTAVHTAPSMQAATVKTYDEGALLRFSRYNDGWYMAVINDTLSFIPKERVMLYSATSNTVLTRWTTTALDLRLAPTSSATVVRTIAAGSSISYIPWTSDGSWGVTSVSIDGVTRSVYFPTSSLTSEAPRDEVVGGGAIGRTSYAISLDDAASFQMGASPWYNGGYASYADVRYYMDPANFDPLSTEYYQFAVLSSYSGLTADDLNQTLQYCSGALRNQGQAFVEAAQECGVNEAYLVAHAILETGWGGSTLAQGWVYSSSEYASGDDRTYYNFFGYGAYDSGPISGGRAAAVRCGWYTPELAIKGCADALGGRGQGYGYIYHGQDTLYEMRFSPASLAQGSFGYQYATSITWPSSIGTLMGEVYANAGKSASLSFDVPVYE